ncbi:MAG TPA: glycosyltransferase family 4 protein [Chthoniobacterales bacterium]|nr:glycosyltransferase family 4 protein [Chthoniobacterales bacterium]
MRVLLVTDWNRSQGGAEAYIGLLRDGLRAAGDEVRLLTSSVGTRGDGAADYVAFGTERIAAQVFLQIVNPFAVASVKSARTELRPDVALVNMFAHHLSPAVLSALKGVPIVLLVSDYKCICPIGSKLLPDGSLCRVKAGWVCYENGCVNALHWLHDQPRYALIRSGLRRVARVLACSDWVRQELARDGISSEVALLPVPPPGLQFRRQPAADPVFVFCGRLDREKGVDLLLRAFAPLHSAFPSARLRIIGRGPLRPHLEAVAGALGLTNAVEFYGWLSPREIETKLCDAWALVVPSVWAEPLGLVAIEAIVRGVPVIASATGGLAEVVQERVSGLLFPNNDVEALFDRLHAIASRQVFPNHILPDQVVARALRTFSIERHLALIRDLFAEVASDSL